MAWGQYNISDDSHVRLSGMLRVLPYRDLVAGQNRSRVGWGVQLSGVWYPANRLTIYAEANTGQGYQSAMNDLAVGNFDLVADATPGYGAVNLFYEPTPRLQVGVEYLIGSRHNFNGEHGHANRVDALFQFSF